MKIGDRGQIILPKRLRERYGLNENVEIELVPEEQGILIQKRSVKRKAVAGLRGTAKLRYAKNVDEYIETIRGQ